jgi:hypothetical protein
MALSSLIVPLLAIVLLVQLLIFFRKATADTSSLERLVIGLEKSQQHAERSIKDDISQSRQELTRLQG